MSLEDWQEDQKNRTWCPKRNSKTPPTIAALKDSTACCAAACSAYKPDSKWPSKNTETDHLGSPTHPNMIQHPYQCPPALLPNGGTGSSVNSQISHNSLFANLRVRHATLQTRPQWLMVSTRQQILARQGKPTSPENCTACQYARSKPGQHVFLF